MKSVLICTSKEEEF